MRASCGIIAGLNPNFTFRSFVRKDTLATRKRIIDTAERLFAERGVESTSLLGVAKASGQKNRSALQYHSRKNGRNPRKSPADSTP